MSLFWIYGILLLVAALPFVLWPLLRRTAFNNDVLRDAANLEILRDQASELETDLSNSLLSQDTFEQGRRELQVRLLEEVKTTVSPVVEPRHPSKLLALILLVLIPLISIALYSMLGNPKALLPPQQNEAAEGFGVLRSEAALQELEAKLVKMPENPDGWLMLARSYTELQRYTDAIRAYEQLVKLVPNESQIWTNYADAMAMANNQSLLGEPTKFIKKALALDPENTTALALAGSSDMEQGDYPAAITHWQKLVSLLPPDYPQIQMIHDGINQAREYLTQQKGGKEQLAKLSTASVPDKAPEKLTANPAVAITGRVTLSPALLAQTSPTDVVFILARAAEGPKMPLAVLRKQVKDLPLDFTLDDSMAMQPQLKLSGFDKVIVLARISKTGTPMAQPGDLQGSAGMVKPGSKGLSITIDSAVK